MMRVTVSLRDALRCARVHMMLFQPHPPPRWLLDHLAHLERLAAAGCANATEYEAAQEEWEPIGTAEAAQILRCSTAYVRRIAYDLDGRHVGRSAWIFDKGKVTEYATHRKARTRRAS